MSEWSLLYRPLLTMPGEGGAEPVHQLIYCCNEPRRRHHRGIPKNLKSSAHTLTESARRILHANACAHTRGLRVSAFASFPKSTRHAPCYGYHDTVVYATSLGRAGPCCCCFIVSSLSLFLSARFLCRCNQPCCCVLFPLLLLFARRHGTYRSKLLFICHRHYIVLTLFIM